jgi:hypothetical protein
MPLVREVCALRRHVETVRLKPSKRSDKNSFNLRRFGGSLRFLAGFLPKTPQTPCTYRGEVVQERA